VRAEIAQMGQFSHMQGERVVALADGTARLPN